MANTKEIQRRIKSISSTKKITKAMEMVAAAKMRKAIEAVLKTRTYANLSWTTVLNLSESGNSENKSNPLLTSRKKIKNVAIVLITSNRGLCGGFNMAIINKARESINKHLLNSEGEKINTEFILIGKKGAAVFTRYGYKVAAQFSKADVCYEAREVVPVAKMVIEDYLSGKYDKVLVAYTDFENASKQIPRVKQLLPIDLDARDDHLGIVGKDPRIGLDKDYIKAKEEKYLSGNYIFNFEPSPEEVLNEMLPRLIEIQLFQALLESNASEHSAAMSAMHQATDAAGDLVSELKLFYNKARQAAITSEIAEISAGANALKG